MILIVDDQKNMCWILSKILSGAGFEVKIANTVKGALATFNKSEISAVIVDFRLPDGNGLDLFLELRRRNGKLPGIFITSYGSNKLRKEALELGFEAYFDKPFDNRALVAALKEALRNERNKEIREK